VGLDGGTLTTNLRGMNGVQFSSGLGSRDRVRVFCSRYRSRLTPRIEHRLERER
jgi:hypothetical protein